MRRCNVLMCALVCAFGSFSAALQAQTYPSRPIQVVVPMAAGTGSGAWGRSRAGIGVLSRLICQKSSFEA